MEFNCTASAEEIKAACSSNELDNLEFEGAEGYESLIEYHMDSSNLETAFFFLLFPLRFLMHFTIPDVRKLNENGEPTATIGKAYLSTISCLLWLIVGSYAMVASLETLGELLGISDAIMGFTVSAAGTQKCLFRLDGNLVFENDVKLLAFALSSSSFLSYRHITTKLRSFKSCGGKGVWESSCIKCIWFQYIQYHVWSWSSLDALY